MHLFEYCVITNYENAKAELVFGNTKSDPLRIRIGIKQGCALSSILFAIYLSEMQWELEHSGLGVELNGEKICALMFADDICLVSPRMRQANFWRSLDAMHKWSRWNSLERNQ